MASCNWLLELDSFHNHSALQETDLGQQFVLEFLLQLAGVEETVPVNTESQLVWPGLVYALNLQSSLRHRPLLKVVHFEPTVSFSIQHPLS